MTGQLIRFRFQRCYSITCRRLAPEDGNEGSSAASKMGLGEKKFKIDWTDKEYRQELQTSRAIFNRSLDIFTRDTTQIQ